MLNKQTSWLEENEFNLTPVLASLCGASGALLGNLMADEVCSQNVLTLLGMIVCAAMAFLLAREICNSRSTAVLWAALGAIAGGLSCAFCELAPTSASALLGISLGIALGKVQTVSIQSLPYASPSRTLSI